MGPMRTMEMTGMRVMMGPALTLHVEEGPRRVLPSAAARPTRVVPLVGGFDGAETQRPALDHRPWRQCTCGGTRPGVTPPRSSRPQTRCRCPLHPWRTPTEPLEGGRGAAGDHAAELGRLPRCHAQLRRLHGGGGGGGGAGCGETRWRGRGGSGFAETPLSPFPRPRRCWPQAVGAVGSGGAAWRSWRWGARWSPGMQRVCREGWGGSAWTPPPRTTPAVTYPVCAPP